MTLQLETVLFNRDTSGGNPAALPVRAPWYCAWVPALGASRTSMSVLALLYV